MKKAVITGIGVVSPLGVGWPNWVEGLRAGRSATGPITHFDPLNPFGLISPELAAARACEPLACRVAAQVPAFNPLEWLSQRDLDRVPRVVPLALAATHEALHTAGLADLSEAERGDVDVVLGSGGGGYSFAEEQLGYWYSGEKSHLSPYAVSSAVGGMLSSEISIAHRFKGRSHTLSNGCTSASDALGTALDLVRSGRSRTVVCGGADAPITPATIAAFCLMRAVPTRYNDRPQNAARPFDRDRDGFVLGEGAWIFVVEEASRAVARGARVWAQIAGYGATCEAFHRVALGTPDEAARAMGLALCDAGTDAGAIDYINLHGTGTQLNDPLETAAVKLAFPGLAGSIPMSSTKSQIGHPQGASGAAGVAATIAAMHHGFVPPTINLDNPATGCDLDYVPNKSRPAQVETALCNCLGFGSKNSALVVRRI